MARVASDLTKAIRRLCDETNFAITHAQARPKLVAMGFPIAAEPGEKSEVYRIWEDHASGRPTKDASTSDMKAWYKATVRAAGLPANAIEAIMIEDAVHRTFCNERNNFDVTKYNYQRKVGTHASQKPEVVTKPTKRPRATEAVVVRNTKPKVVVADAASAAKDVELITWLLEQGGVAKVEKKIADLKALLDEMASKLEKATVAVSKLTSSAA